MRSDAMGDSSQIEDEILAGFMLRVTSSRLVLAGRVTVGPAERVPIPEPGARPPAYDLSAAIRWAASDGAPWQEEAVSRYLITGSYTREGIKGVMAEGGTARVAAVGRLIGSLGGSVESMYFGFGGDDFYITCDLPGNAEAAAGAMTAAASGAVNLRTVVLLTPEEVDAAVKLSADYRAPGG
jgi:uncharacterized protein with GYD domain